MKRRSFQSRLALLAGGVSGVMLLLFGIAAWLIMKEQFMTSVDARIALPAERLSRHIVPEKNWKRRLERDWESSWKSEPGSERVFLVTDHDGEGIFTAKGSEWLEILELKTYLPAEEQIEELRAQSEPLPRLPGPPGRPGFPGPRGDFDADRPPSRNGLGEGPPDRPPFDDRPPRGPPPGHSLPHTPPVFFTVVDEGGAQWRLASMSNTEATVFTGAPLAHFERELTRMRDYLFAVVPIGLLAVGGVGWLISRRALRPLERISETASHVTAMGLDERIPVTGREYAEFSQLVNVLNDMMGRLESSFQQATRFTADASHELKTPIALLQAEVESALKTCPPGSEQQTTLLNIADEIQRLKRITQSLLLLSQVDAGHLHLSPETVDLSAECEGLCEDAEVLCDKSALQLQQDIEPGIAVEADRVLLMQAAQNLLTNAVKYNHEGGRVACSLRRENGEAVLEFANTGPQIPPEEREAIFDRFYRLDPSRDRTVDGFGLGLNLALEIVRAHGGTLRLVDGQDDLTTFRIRLKADAEM